MFSAAPPFKTFLVLIVSLCYPTCTLAQFCSNTCPPLNFGIPVPSLCEGDFATEFADTSKQYTICHPIITEEPSRQVSFDALAAAEETKVIVLASFYIGCNAGRRESGVYAHVAQRFYEEYGDQTIFLTSLKGGTTCAQWADLYQADAVSLFPDSGVIPNEMPLSILDQEYELRDDFFTTPFGHPSYVIMDGSTLEVKHKFIGPCCGYERYADCTADIATTLDTNLTEHILAMLNDADAVVVTPPDDDTTPGTEEEEEDDDTLLPPPVEECIASEYSEWSECSITCGTTAIGIQFRWRNANDCEEEGDDDELSSPPVQTQPCTPTVDCDPVCIPEFGDNAPRIKTIASGFDGARDVALHPTPGHHLGSYSEGRTFDPTVGEEAWVLNALNHSLSIVAALGNEEHQTTISRRDRGYYHYMANATAIAFNTVGDSGRSADRDSFNYWAVCNDNFNTYLGTKEPNNFMGPTLYNSGPRDRNLVNRLGEECGLEEECFFLHSDMLHEAPACIGIAHDPETTTAYGTVYWAFDSTGNGLTGQLVRFDFQQPHGPGSMDHSVAAVRRYPQVQLARGPDGVHAGMVVHPTTRQVFIAVPGGNHILVVDADSGEYARTAREEYPIFSNQLPSFEYSIWECPDQHIFASNIRMPTGLVLSADGERLFVAERETGDILVYEVSSGSLLSRVNTDFKTIGGLTFSEKTDTLYFVDEETNTLNAIEMASACETSYTSRVSPSFEAERQEAISQLGNAFSLNRDYSCIADPIVPDASFFDQVHDDSGYASDDPNVQSMAGMDAAAALLANRTDCEPTSDLNFDALLLGGYFCHVCLPGANGAECDAGGECTNVQWLGYTCDNEFIVVESALDGGIELQTPDSTPVDMETLALRPGVTYRFTIKADMPVCLFIEKENGRVPLMLPENESGCAQRGPLLYPVSPDNDQPSNVFLGTSPETSVSLPIGKFESEPVPVKGGSGPNVGAIVGPILAGCALICLLVFFYYRRRRQHQSEHKQAETEKDIQELTVSPMESNETAQELAEQPQDIMYQGMDVELSVEQGD